MKSWFADQLMLAQRRIDAKERDIQVLAGQLAEFEKRIAKLEWAEAMKASVKASESSK